jgi:uncharacterized protein YqgC (DUF456 family)
VLAILGWTAFGIAVAVGLALDMLGLFGNWIILGALAALWIVTGFEHFGWAGVGLIVGLAVLGELLETLAAGYGASKFGGSRGSIVAALVGCLLGAILLTPVLPIIGTLIGACIGAFAGAASYEYLQMQKDVDQAVWTGVGAVLGRVGGMFAKLFAGFAMLAVAAFTY